LTRSIRVLVVDDNEAHAEAVAEGLQRDGYETIVARSGSEGAEALKSEPVDVVVTDLVMPEVGGLEILKLAHEMDPRIEVILVTAHGTVDSAVEALREGAFHYLLKPLSIKELRHFVGEAVKKQSLVREVKDLKEAVSEKYGFEILVGSSAGMQRVYSVIRQVAGTSATVFILGETGTGKELVARAIHHNSPRRDRPFVGLNCAALSRDILESELFGHEKGAFTGAISTREGLFEYADGGTILLDEILDMPAETQVKLLRVLEEGEIRRVGSNKPLKVDVRVLAATNRSPEEAVQSGQFRQDLYFRIKVVTIQLPALRERTDDIPLLTEKFIAEFNQRHQKDVDGITHEAMNMLVRFSWPGNVRELRNVIENMVVMATHKTLDVNDLPESIYHAPEQRSLTVPLRAGMSLEEAERKLIRETLELTQGNREEAAKILGIGERTLYRKLKEYKLS